MLLRRTYGLTAAATLLNLCVSPSSGQAQRSGNTTDRTLDRLASGQWTCPSRSINYITHTLPQQCLRTDWSRETQAPTLNFTRVEVNSGLSSSTTSGIYDVTATTSSGFQRPTESTTGTITIHPSNGTTSTVTSPEFIVPSSSSTTTTTLSQPSTPSATARDNEGDSPLDKANFLSFEEWKRQNLAKVGQSADHVGAGRAGVGEAEQRRRPGQINNAFDSLGEDTEIEIDFGGFTGPGVPSQAIPSQKAATDGVGPSTSGQSEGEKHIEEVPSSHPRGKDAGKTCKERSNYASFDCAATVLKTNPECKGSNSILVENKDSYMLNECSAKNKFFIVELCDDILIDTVVLANFEFFSSMFRTFRVSVSDRYPVKLDKWRDIGIFEARNTREVQAFLIKNPLIWARYVRVEFLAHFGNEYYCPVSLFRVHGTTMMEEFNHEVKGSIGEDDSENDVGGEEEAGEPEPVSDVIMPDTLKDTSEVATHHITQTVTKSTMISTSTLTVISQDSSRSNVKSISEASELGSTPFNALSQSNMESLFASRDTSSSVCVLEDQKPQASSSLSNPLPSNHVTESTKVGRPSSSHSAPSHMSTSTNETSTKIGNDPVENSIAAPLKTSDSGNGTKTHSPSKSANQTSQNSTKTHPSVTHPSSPNPTTQESFFKSAHKRLQLLESNSTLSLQYIEDQSRILRDAFSAVEKRQLTKTSAFLETLNSTVLSELRDFRSQYDQIWQSTVLELSAQRESSQNEVLALSARISLLADEMVFQKRIAILQFALILICLALVIFPRNGSAAHYLELPTLALNRSSSSLSGFGPHFETPPPTRPSSQYGIFGRGNVHHERNPSSPPGSTRTSSRYGIFSHRNAHQKSLSDDSTLNERTQRPDIEFSPPTPTSESTDLRGNCDEEEGEMSEGLSESSDTRRATRKIYSSPATLSRRGPGRRAFEEGGLLMRDPDTDEAHTCEK